MANDENDLLKLDHPLTDILSHYNKVSQRTRAPTDEYEAHFLGIGLPRLRWLKDVNRLSEDDIQFLDKFGIHLPVAARISHMCEEVATKFTETQLADIAESDEPLQVLWMIEKGDFISQDELIETFISEGYCGLASKHRESHLGPAEKKSFDERLRGILSSTQRRKNASPKMRNAIFQGIIQESDKAHLWTAAGLRQKCPKSVDLLEKWIEQNL